MNRLMMGALAIMTVAAPLSADEKVPVKAEDLRQAAAKGLQIIQHSQVAWNKQDRCSSCHHQLLPELSFQLARERGIDFDAKVADQITARSFAYLKGFDSAVQGIDFIDVVSEAWTLFGANAAGIPASLTTDAFAQFLAGRQQPDGFWMTMDARPPQSHSRFTATAIAIKGIRDYLPAQFKDEKEKRIAKARDWLLKNSPRTTEDKAFQLLALLWTNAGETERKQAAAKLKAEQRDDGGWAQIKGRDSDSYATGQALFALHQAGGMPPNDPVFQNGLRFLLQTKNADGSWRVESRLHEPGNPSPPYFDAEFPHKKHQFASIMGTCWAVNAMLCALPADAKAVKRNLPNLAPPENAAWIDVALNGSVADFEKLLKNGLDPNTKTKGATSLLMLAARDFEKVKLLIENKADVNALAASNFTPLMVAARYRGNGKVIKLLLEKGASPVIAKGKQPVNDLHAAFIASTTGDRDMAKAILDAKGDVTSAARLLGMVPFDPINFAIGQGDREMAALLIEHKADPGQIDDDLWSVLDSATIGNHKDAVRLLLDHKVNVNHKDKHGYTALHYAAAIDFGDTEIVDMLLKAGADGTLKNLDGNTPLDLAIKYKHQAIAERLKQK